MIEGSLTPPGDKSITHRALIFSSLTQGATRIENASSAADCASTARCMQAMGLAVENLDSPDGEKRNCFSIQSGGLGALKQPSAVLDVGNSGTTIRIMSGLLAGLPFECELDGDASIRKRPMARVIEPLEKMGAKIEAVDGNFAPLKISGGNLTGCNFELKVASAQVQTCLLLAGLQAKGKTSVATPGTVRDHTVRMFSHLGIDFESDGRAVTVEKLTSPAKPATISVPADISSAAFFMVLASCAEGSGLILNSVGLNPGRIMILDVLKEMGASIEVLNERMFGLEPVCDLRVKYSGRLKAINLDEARVPAGIDEIPVLALACTLADGKSTLKGLSELRHKESDRLNVLVSNLKASGAQVEEGEDWISVNGTKSVEGGGPWQTFGDHRMAMTGAIASLLFEEPVEVDDPECASVSYPEFYEDLASLTSD